MIFNHFERAFIEANKTIFFEGGGGMKESDFKGLILF